MSVRKSKLTYENDETVLCFHGPLLYEAKILKGEFWDGKEGEVGPHYFIHYKGWKVKWDEWVPEVRILKYNEANLQKKKELKEKSSARQKESAEQPSKKPRLDEQKAKELDLDIPERIVATLVDDWENITKQQMLVSLPRSPTVAEVLDEFYQKVVGNDGGDEDGCLKEVISGLKAYFDMALGKMLLYRFERAQYAEVRKERGEEARMSEVYGTEHLLRLFVRTHQLMSSVRMEPEAIGTLTEVLNDLLAFILENHSRFILSEYENATPEYLSLCKVF